MTICPSKSAKKKAKKKAAAARKADFVERDEVEGFAPAGTNNHEDHSPEANGATPADSSEMARKKSKNKGMLASNLVGSVQLNSGLRFSYSLRIDHGLLRKCLHSQSQQRRCKQIPLKYLLLSCSPEAFSQKESGSHIRMSKS